MAHLHDLGLMSLKGSIDEVAKALGASRSSIYYYTK